MQSLRIPLLACVVLATGICLLDQFEPNKEKTSATADSFIEKGKPFEQFYFQRSYPDDVIDEVAFKTALKDVQKDIDAQAGLKNSINANWRVEGPTNLGGRINAIEIDPNNSNIIYTGCSSGGIFKTTNGGTTWTPIADAMPQTAISDITIDPQNSNTIWVATGDHNISGLPHIGDGVYKSTDGGQTWNQMGLQAECIISRILVHPTNSNIAYAAAMGKPFVMNNNRGLYKTTDGGQTWNQIHFISNQAGVVDVVMDPFNPNTLYCSGWDRIRTNSQSIGTGPGGKIWKSTDGGANWTMLTNGLPSYNTSRVGLSISQLTPGLVFAVVIDTTYAFEGLYKTTNGGTSWTQMGTNGLDQTFVRNFGWYFAQVRVSPFNDNHISMLGVEMQTTFDGGANWFRSVPAWTTYQVHADEHDLVYINANTCLLGTDGGLYKTTNNMSTWTDVDDIPNSQYYRIAIDPHQPGVYAGGAQDNGTSSGNYLSTSTWPREFGGDGFQTMYDPNNATLRYFETQNGGLYFWDGFNYYLFDSGINPSDRTNWDQPIRLGKNDPTTAITGTYRMWKMKTGAPWSTWDSISNDLTDGLIYKASFHNISSLDESSLDSKYIFAGTSDGNVWTTINDGVTWSKVSSSLPDRYVTSVIGSDLNKNHLYVTHSGYKDNDNTPHIHKSTNLGTSWTDISGDLPQIAINDLVIMQGTGDSVMMVATDAGVYATIRAGSSWKRVGGNMPAIPVFDLEIDYVNRRLVAGTFARSIQSFPIDSILEQSTVGIEDHSAKPTFSIYPTPARDVVNFTAKNIGSETYDIKVYSLSGKLVYSRNTALKSRQQIPVAHLDQGTYIISVRSEAHHYTEKFLKL